MKILSYEARMTSLAVEKIEEKYDMSLDELVGGKLRAKDVNFIIWACMEDAPELDEVKKELAKEYTYTELLKVMNGLFNVSNEEEGDTETK